MKIAVYTIAKNELQFCETWAASCAEADYRVVADTGSTDGTQQTLRDLGVSVTEVSIQPWRFDRAREASLALVPADADLCITLDMDEQLQPGWRAAAEAAWVSGSTRLHYRYIWNWLPDGSPGISFMGERGHSRDGYRWVHPVHETLKPLIGLVEQHVWSEDIAIHHHADESKPRAQYMPLLKLAVAEAPEDDRCVHYLGRELMFYGENEAAIAELQRHLALKSAVWRPERSASMRYIARCQEALGDQAAALQWLIRGCAEAPEYRECWVDFAGLCHRLQDWHGGVWATRRALLLDQRQATYLVEPQAWGHQVYDIGSICAYYAGDTQLAREWLIEAMKLAPGDDRLARNAEFILGSQAA